MLPILTTKVLRQFFLHSYRYNYGSNWVIFSPFLNVLFLLLCQNFNSTSFFTYVLPLGGSAGLSLSGTAAAAAAVAGAGEGPHEAGQQVRLNDCKKK